MKGIAIVNCDFLQTKWMVYDKSIKEKGAYKKGDERILLDSDYAFHAQTPCSSFNFSKVF